MQEVVTPFAKSLDIRWFVVRFVLIDVMGLELPPLAASLAGNLQVLSCPPRVAVLRENPSCIGARKRTEFALVECGQVLQMLSVTLARHGDSTVLARF